MSEEIIKAGKSAPSTPDSNASAAGKIAIVASRYNADFTDALVKSASETLGNLLPNAELKVIRVPGAYEIPVVVEAICRREKPAAVLALGVIIRGSTAHADLIAESITRCLHDSSRDHLVPVIHEVLLVENADQAKERSLGDELNRGREAAEAAVEMIGVMSDLQS